MRPEIPTFPPRRGRFCLPAVPYCPGTDFLPRNHDMWFKASPVSTQPGSGHQRRHPGDTQQFRTIRAFLGFQEANILGKAIKDFLSRCM